MNMAHPQHQGKRYLDKTRKKNIPDFLEMRRRRRYYRSGII
jgi:hypothetical protein